MKFTAEAEFHGFTHRWAIDAPTEAHAHLQAREDFVGRYRDIPPRIVITEWPWVDLAYVAVFRNRTEPPGHPRSGEPAPEFCEVWAVGSNKVLQEETELEDFTWADLANHQVELGITRWIPRPEDFEGEDEVTMIGQAQAPITRESVQSDWHNGTQGSPVLNVKIHQWPFFANVDFAQLQSYYVTNPKLASITPDQLKMLVDQYSANNEWPFNQACESGWEFAKDEAVNHFGQHVKVYSAGRSGGWLVVEGLHDIAEWDLEMLTKWWNFEHYCEAEVNNIPYAAASNVLLNAADELAERVLSLRVQLILGDKDAGGDPPVDWDWKSLADDDNTIFEIGECA